MNTVAYIQRFSNHLLGRLAIILTGVFVIYCVLTLYPPIEPVIWWAFPVLIFIWGGSRLYYYGVRRPLTVIAGCLLMLGGISRALFQLIPMDELTGTVANLIPFLGLIAEMYAQHYREHD